MTEQEQNETADATPPSSYWEVFLDDVFLLFFFSAAIYFLLYIVWGLVELGSVPISPLMLGAGG